MEFTTNQLIPIPNLIWTEPPWSTTEARSSACPQTARCGTATTAQRPRLAELKPLLKDLFEEQAEAQDAQQLQSKIDQLQKLQQILQMQQEGLKQQQKVAQSYQPKVQRLSEYHPPARGYSASMTSPRGDKGSPGAVYPMSFMLPLMEEIWRSPVEVGSLSHSLQQVVQDFFHQQ